MARAKAAVSEHVSLGPAKVKRLIVKNFRCIGREPVEIDLDEIVVLVGANNAGKSTILRAYQVVMCHGSTEGRLTLSDFPNEQIDAANLPEIELQTYIDPDTADKPGTEWLLEDAETGRKYVSERWTWDSPNKDPNRQGKVASTNEWDVKVPWGAPNVANARRPEPHRVDAFATPETQAREVIGIIKAVLKEQAEAQNGDDALSALDKLKHQIVTLQADLIKSSQVEIERIEDELSEIICEVFKGFRVTIDARHEEISEKALSLFQQDPVMRMGPADGHAAPIEHQGSGARRTLLWSALKLVKEKKSKKAPAKAKGKASAESDEGVEDAVRSRPHVLLMDEPEICLHPNAVREACRVLYDLASDGSGWQVMLTTHSPAFIDLSKDNTTIVRVERDEQGSIRGTTVFRPNRAQLDNDDKTLLKLLNLWDPYVGEFFFGGRSIIVEGDTEYSAFQLVIDRERDTFGDVHVIRARGKFIIPALMKILNHFGSGYAVLHDSDTPLTKKGAGNPAWVANERVLTAGGAAPRADAVRIVASVPNFEEAFLGIVGTNEKPYGAVLQITQDDAAYSAVRELLLSLLDPAQPLPQGALAWKEVAELEAALAAHVPVDA